MSLVRLAGASRISGFSDASSCPVGENFLRSQLALDLDADDIYTLAKNAFTASFLSEAEKKRYIAELDQAMN